MDSLDHVEMITLVEDEFGELPCDADFVHRFHSLRAV